MFETPLFLIGALIGGMVPLVLHMMRKRRSAPRPFPTLRFLYAAQQASSRRARIEHLLLWLLRTAIMVLLGLAFAMPVLRATGGGILGRAPRDIAIVLDISYSMRYLIGRDTVFDQSVETAVELLQGLNKGDRFCIVTAGREPRALFSEPIADIELGINQLRALQPSWESSRLLPAIDLALDTLGKVTGSREKELHILTDNQALAWARNAADHETPGDDDARKDRKLTVFAAFAGAPNPENLAPLDIKLNPAVIARDGSARLTFDLGRTGPAVETTVTLFINNDEVSRRVVSTDSAAREPLTFTLPPMQPGVHVGRIETPVDNLAVDDAFHFLLAVRDTLPTLVVGEEADTFFLRAALRASGHGDSFAVVPPAAAGGARFAEYSTVFLCNALPLSGQAIAALELAARRGGLIVLFPGSRAALSDYRAWPFLPAFPREVADVPRAQARQTIFWSEPEHPIVRGFDAAPTAPLLAVQRVLEFDPPGEEVVTPATIGAERPLLIERAVGEGRVALFSVSADRAWSNLPLTPFYLPLIAQMVSYGAGLGAPPPFIRGGASLALDRILPDAEPGIGLLAPNGARLSVRTAIEDGRARLFVEDVVEPGIVRRTDREDPSPALAVNLPADEADLTPVVYDQLDELLGVDNLHIAFDRETLAGLLREHRVGRTYGELLLWIVLALVIIEFVHANRLARAGASREGSFATDVAGRISAHSSAGGTPS